MNWRKIQEARRVKMLHCPSKIQVLHELAEKSSDSVHFLKEENDMPSYELQGLETLGSMLHIVIRDNASIDFSNGSIQWFRIQPEGSKKEIISGATKVVYAPEPHDVGWYIQAEITFGGQILIAKIAGPVDHAAGLADYAEALMRNPETEYNVSVLQVNVVAQPADSLHVLCIGRLRMRLAKGAPVIAKEFYSSSMQLCGVRGGGDAAPQAIFWQPRKELSFVLGFETRECNSALMLARRFAMDRNIILAGPGDKTPW
uniref:Stomatal closure-related actin-binding protein PH domain-containing protein n=1 Tax=Setaria italica TaxID=4555 RepID=K3XPL1_SETIT